MTKILPILSLFALSLVAVGADAGGKHRSYQVTGEVVEVTDAKVVVDKDGEKFEIARPKDLKAGGGELKVGARVTVQYQMTATDIEIKPEKAKAEKAEKAADKAVAKPALKK